MAGPLVIIGGAEDKTGDCKVLKSFVEIAGGADARIVVIAVASEKPTEIGAQYLDVFKKLGASEVRRLGISNRSHANASTAVEAIEKATGVFFTGGNQVRITRMLGGTNLDTALHKRHEEGLALAGTSAGASMMSTIMILGGLTDKSFRLGIVELGPGMEFISGVLIDQHFEERGRLRRLLSAVAQYPRDLGLGIDENTAVIVRDHIFEVIGEGSVTVVDAGSLTYTNITSLKKNDLLTLCGVKIHVLNEGCRFDLLNRKPLIEADAVDAERVKEAVS